MGVFSSSNINLKNILYLSLLNNLVHTLVASTEKYSTHMLILSCMLVHMGIIANMIYECSITTLELQIAFQTQLWSRLWNKKERTKEKQGKHASSDALASYGVMAAILQFLNGCALTSPWFPFQDFSMFIGPKMHLSHEWLGKNSGGGKFVSYHLIFVNPRLDMLT